ncbi:MAG: GTPase HflX [Kordiimonas sp.]|nr:GTPase HflX [Kordiimonas sp.]
MSSSHGAPENLRRKKTLLSLWENNEKLEGISEGHFGARALILHPYLKHKLRGQREASAASTAVYKRGPVARLEETVSLAAAIDLNVIQAVTIALPAIRPATYIGKGKLDELSDYIHAHDIELVVGDCSFSPIQQRNLEKALGVKVIDRTGLILEIFGERAQTREGTLQVELAHLNYQKSRLVRSWTHLERQRGGVGFLGGPGETQIEADRRMIGERIAKIRRQLEDVTRTRALHRKSRKKVPYPIVAFVGYTNAGKSTLFNRLTAADVMAEDLLFATLDPTMRVLPLASGKKVILSDTVGFISELPTDLVAAFRATLEEVIEADIIVHIRDIAHADSEAQKEDVLDVLKSLGVEEREDRKIIEVWNKIDLLPAETYAEVTTRGKAKENVLSLSAVTGDGCAHLLDIIDQSLSDGEQILDFSLRHDQGADLAWLYAHGDVVSREDDEDKIRLSVRLGEAEVGRLEKRGLTATNI